MGWLPTFGNRRVMQDRTMRDELAGKIALVTGASRGIKRAIAVGLGGPVPVSQSTS